PWAGARGLGRFELSGPRTPRNGSEEGRRLGSPVRNSGIVRRSLPGRLMFPLLVSLVLPLLFPQDATVKVPAGLAEAEQLLGQGRVRAGPTPLQPGTQGHPSHSTALPLTGAAHSGSAGS